MKTSSKWIIGVAAVLVAGAITYRAVNSAPDSSLPANGQMLAVIEDGGCTDCHSAAPKMPFYANWPIAKTLIAKDIEDGSKMFDIEPLIAALRNGTAPGQVDLAKTEMCVLDGSMPLPQYYLVHWGSSLTGAKQEVMLEGIKGLRAQFYPNRFAAKEFANETIRPIPDEIVFDEAKARLGKDLYNDTRLSGDGTISCATCHALDKGGTDNLQYSEGINGQFGGINAPTTFNAIYNFVQFWDGRAANLAAQAAGPPTNPVEMGSASFDEIIAKLSADKEFKARFEAVYPEGLSEKNITDAIAEYEKTLITPGSPFDMYLMGAKDALSEEQIEGFKIFKEYKCATCHAGENMGGLSYELMGQRDNYFQDRETNVKSGLTDADNGRWAQTGVERDRYRFKTPSLRNVALTAPYYHDGSVQTLEEAIAKMARFQSGKKMSDDKVAMVKSFLEAQTGELTTPLD